MSDTSESKCVALRNTLRPIEPRPVLLNPATGKERWLENTLLLAVPDPERRLLQDHLELIDLPHRAILQQAEDKIDYAYFPTSGLVSLLILTHDGRSVEIGVVGSEGMIGTPLTVQMRWQPCRAVVQMPGRGFRIRSEALEEVLRSAPELTRILNRYVLLQGLQVAQIAACNRLHEVEQRLARWLLMCQDRVGLETLPVTHEALSQMLGTGRPSVTLAAAALQRTDLILNMRGTVKILKREALEQAACECYRAIRDFGRELA
jgi:CRP-like cAMP-binding protein